MELRVRIEDIFKRDGYGVTLSSDGEIGCLAFPQK